ncbi:galactan 5-O-arabinofuranosyltransferase [Corynebacterium sp. P3-F1]|uniref:galactan 5-O-arabinofuranosyltransferase n=1 Tax=Corynebacterium sp. P3-F1 TaxID=3059080 RepID=UPI00265CC527|nr:galactan 5-O-arabinofuranosyltransferase [Corynebacterium sp. P3-F1]WKK60664.1 galactan 5-O-arabinofuranosyltransferase [Corynebacterium sp. P3-F1]
MTEHLTEQRERQSGSTIAERKRVSAHAPDRLSTSGALVRFVCALLGGAAFALVSWYILHSVSLAAFNVSMLTRALATACSLLVIVAVAALTWLWLRDGDGRRPRWREVLTELVCTLAPAGLVVSALGVPLSATKLYLDGIQVDQGFRTQFLTRMAESAANQDMNYIDMPTFYPLGWFWLGGRMSNLLGMPGWEVYQPWALMSLAAAGAALVPVWRKLIGSLPVATAIALATTAICLTMVPDEPYAAIVAMGVPAAAVMGCRAMRGSWESTIALTVFLGVSACFYTLYTGIVALMMVTFAVIAMVARPRGQRWWVPLRQLAVMGFGSIAIALVAWAPYITGLLTSPEAVKSTAQHFLPSEGTTIPMPFFELSAVGALSLLGLIYIVARFREPEITYLALAVSVCYAWVFGSMVIALAGTTLLGFRVEVLIALLLSTTGIFAIADLRLAGVEFLYPDRLNERGNRTVTALFVVLLAAGALAYIQQIPDENESFIDQAYTSTDGNGERADRRESDVGRYYIEMNDFIQDQGYEPADTVLLTDEINFMVYHPYHGFNAFTSHYANPLGEFEARSEAIASWARGSFRELSDPAEFTKAIDETNERWRSPDVFILRGSETDPDEPWKTHIAHDIFPSQPNVHYEALFFNPKAFDSADWTTQQFGPFVVVVRNK